MRSCDAVTRALGSLAADLAAGLLIVAVPYLVGGWLGGWL